MGDTGAVGGAARHDVFDGFWNPEQELAAEQLADHAQCFELAHALAAARLLSYQTWSKRALLVLGVAGGSTQLTDALRVAGTLQALPLVLLFVTLAHALFDSMQLPALAAQHASLSKAWLELGTSMRSQLELERSLRAPLREFLAQHQPRYAALRAQSLEAICLADKRRFKDAVVDRVPPSMRVPPELGGSLQPTVACTRTSPFSADEAPRPLPSGGLLPMRSARKAAAPASAASAATATRRPSPPAHNEIENL